MSKPLKNSVREHLESKSLTAIQLQKLESLVDNVEQESAPRNFKYALLVSTVLAVFVLALFVLPQVTEQPDMREKIALEVASHHLKLKPLEIETSSIKSIRDYFTRLDFLPMNSQLISDAGLELVGGRYCSLQGITAAQLRVKKPGSDVVQMLYQVEYRKDVFDKMPLIEEGELPVEVYVKGIKVKIWVEKGLLFVLSDVPEA